MIYPLPQRYIHISASFRRKEYGRLGLDYELLPEVSEAFIYAAMVRILLRRLSA